MLQKRKITSVNPGQMFYSAGVTYRMATSAERTSHPLPLTKYVQAYALAGDDWIPVGLDPLIEVLVDFS